MVEVLVQSKRDVGIFRRIFGRLAYVNLVKRQLFCAFSCYVFERHWLVAQIFSRQAVHIMTSRRAVKDIRLQHGVSDYSSNR